ncbi:MAG: hypothetical protein HY763_17140 [Planctomycetes bacterium]|nr:hypothetical protein [Planctomycetota bacterium]
MKRVLLAAIVAAGLLFPPTAGAAVVISFEARDVTGATVAGAVATGSLLTVDIFLAVDGADNPLADLRGLSFDFTQTSSALVPVQFTWILPEDGNYFQDSSLPNPSAATTFAASAPGLLGLSSAGTKVATVSVTANGDGTLDLLGPGDGNPDSTFFTAGFTDVRDFSPGFGNVSGGTLALTVSGSTDPTPGPGPGPDPTPTPDLTDSDGDGVVDSQDALPDDPAETVDTDADGVGNQADTDDDGDAAPDESDAFPIDPAETADTDGDGVGDNADAFPEDPTQTDMPDDGTTGGEPDTGDGDGDGEVPPDTGDDGTGVVTTPRRGGGLCGLGMLGATLTVLTGLTGLRLPRILRRWSCRGAGGFDGTVHPVFRVSGQQARRAVAGLSRAGEVQGEHHQRGHDGLHGARRVADDR